MTYFTEPRESSNLSRAIMFKVTPSPNFTNLQLQCFHFNSFANWLLLSYICLMALRYKQSKPDSGYVTGFACHPFSCCTSHHLCYTLFIVANYVQIVYVCMWRTCTVHSVSEWQESVTLSECLSVALDVSTDSCQANLDFVPIGHI